MKNELIVNDQQQQPPRHFMDMQLAERIESASAVAEQLKDIIVKQNLWVNMGRGGKDVRPFVLVEGWQCLGNLTGMLPKEHRVEWNEREWTAYVNLVRVDTGTVVAGASAICSHSERSTGKGQWTDNNRRSMAITRATGKAYKLAFGWIVKLAGYESTPAEEMEGVKGIKRFPPNSAEVAPDAGGERAAPQKPTPAPTTDRPAQDTTPPAPTALEKLATKLLQRMDEIEKAVPIRPVEDSKAALAKLSSEYTNVRASFDDATQAEIELRGIRVKNIIEDEESARHVEPTDNEASF